MVTARERVSVAVSLNTCDFELEEDARRGMCGDLALVKTGVRELNVLYQETPILQMPDVFDHESVVGAVRRQSNC